MTTSLQSHRQTRLAPATVVAACLLAVKGLLGVWAGLVLMTTSPTNVRSFLGSEVHTRRTGLGVVLLVLAVATLAVAASLVQRRPWARPAAYGLEAVGIVLALSRVASRPGAAAFSLVLSAAVIGLLLARPAPSRPEPPA